MRARRKAREMSIVIIVSLAVAVFIAGSALGRVTSACAQCFSAMAVQCYKIKQWFALDAGVQTGI